MPLPKEMDAIEGKSVIRNPNGTDEDELDEYFYKDSST